MRKEMTGNVYVISRQTLQARNRAGQKRLDLLHDARRRSAEARKWYEDVMVAATAGVLAGIAVTIW